MYRCRRKANHLFLSITAGGEREPVFKLQRGSESCALLRALLRHKSSAPSRSCSLAIVICGAGGLEPMFPRGDSTRNAHDTKWPNGATFWSQNFLELNYSWRNSSCVCRSWRAGSFSGCSTCSCIKLVFQYLIHFLFSFLWLWACSLLGLVALVDWTRLLSEPIILYKRFMLCSNEWGWARLPLT